MKRRLGCILMTLGLSAGFLPAVAQGTAFTYNGRLNDSGAPAGGSYDLRFTLCDAVTNGNAVASVTNLATGVSNGLFTVTLDFGEAFNGPNYWLEIAARTNGASTFAVLNPRQPVLPVPYAIMANSASNLLGTLPAEQLGAGNVGAQLYFANQNNQFYGIFNGMFNGNGNGLFELNPASLAPGTASVQLSLTNPNNQFYGIFNGMLNGNGNGLFDLNPASLATGTASVQLSLTNPNNQFYGIFNGMFNGNGNGLFDLNPAGLAPGTASVQLSLTNPNNQFYGIFNGMFNGNGNGLFDLNPASLAPGTASVQLSLTNPNNQFYGNFDGLHSGDGSGLTNLSADAIQGGLTTNLPVLVPGGGTNILCFTNGILRAVQ